MKKYKVKGMKKKVACKRIRTIPMGKKYGHICVLKSGKTRLTAKSPIAYKKIKRKLMRGQAITRRELNTFRKMSKVV